MWRSGRPALLKTPLFAGFMLGVGWRVDDGLAACVS